MGKTLVYLFSFPLLCASLLTLILFLSRIHYISAPKARQTMAILSSSLPSEVELVPTEVTPTPSRASEQEIKAKSESSGPCRYVPILMYHHVDDQLGSLFVETAVFTQQMDYLVKKGYNTISLVDLMENLKNGKTLPAKPLVITFDDGYRDNYTNAYPILIARNLKATFFLITQLMGGDRYLTWEQAREMAGNPLVTMGDHTLSHKPLASLSPERVHDEIFSSKSILESNLGSAINVFAYPYGSNSTEAKKNLGEAGFVAAVTTQRGVSCAKLPYDLPRIRIGNSSLSFYGL